MLVGILVIDGFAILSLLFAWLSIKSRSRDFSTEEEAAPSSLCEVSLVVVRRSPQRLPLLTIMAKDDQRHVLALDHIQQFPRAGAQLLLVVIKRPGLTIRGEKALHSDCINSQQHRAALRQAHQHRLMPRRMPTGLEQRQARQEFGISINQPVTQRRMIPVSAYGCKASMSAAR